MLRASSKSAGKEVAVRGVVAPHETKVNVAHEELLMPFAESAVKHEHQALAHARTTLLESMGAGALVDASVLVGNFERMNRIADACGIALGDLGNMFQDIVQELDIEHFGK